MMAEAKSPVILVTINSRLGQFGFLSTEDERAPGNLGNIDQINALKWVQRNIRQFNGDPKRVTVFGSDSGATDVSILLASPRADGLFAAAISMSGNTNSLQTRALDSTRALAKSVGCYSFRSSDILQCLRHLPAERLLLNNGRISPALFRPRIDAESRYPVLLGDPVTQFAQGRFNRVPILYGFSDGEGLAVNGLLPTPLNAKGAAQIDQDFLGTVCTKYLNLGDRSSDVQKACQTAREVYLHNEPLTLKNLRGFYEMIGDRTYVQSFFKSALATSAYTPTWAYHFKFFDRVSANLLNFLSGSVRRNFDFDGFDMFKYTSVAIPPKSRRFLARPAAQFGVPVKKVDKDYVFVNETSHADDTLYLFSTPRRKIKWVNQLQGSRTKIQQRKLELRTSGLGHLSWDRFR